MNDTDCSRNLTIKQSTQKDVTSVAYTKKTVPRCDVCYVEIWSTESQLYVRDGLDNYCRDCWMDRTSQDIQEIVERPQDTERD